MRILYIEDDQALRELMQEVLEGEGFEVIIAGTGNEGIERFGEVHPDVVITDLIMPDGDGEEVIEAIKRTPEPHPGIIVFSGMWADDGMTIEEHAKRLGADAGLAKPVEFSALLEAIRSIRP